MLGQRFLPTSYQAKLYQMDYDKHQRRLDQINKTSKSVAEEKEEFFRSTFTESRSRHQKFQTSEKLISIDKTNQVLLDKLVKISRNQKPPLFKTTTNWPSHPGTLNTGFRKKQLEKIAQENEAMAKRLITQQGSVNRRKLDQDFEKHLEFSKNVQKINSPKIDKLLPIRSPKSQETPKGFKVRRKKAAKKNSASVQMEGTKIDGEPTEETQSKEYIPTTQSQADVHQNESENLEKTQQAEENDMTAVSKDVETENKEAETDKEAVADNQVQADNKDAADGEVKSVVKETAEAEAEEQEEERDGFVPPQEVNGDKSERTQENKSQVSTHRTKRSGTVQPPSNFEKSRINSTRKGSTSNADAKDDKAKSTTREAAQIQTNRSKNEMDKSQLDKSTLKSERKGSPTPSQNQNQNQSFNQSQVQTQRKSPQLENESARGQTVGETPNQTDANEQIEESNQGEAQASVQRSTKEKEVEEEERIATEEKQEETARSTQQQAVVSERKQEEQEPQKEVSAERGTS